MKNKFLHFFWNIKSKWGGKWTTMKIPTLTDKVEIWDYIESDFFKSNDLRKLQYIILKKQEDIEKLEESLVKSNRINQIILAVSVSTWMIISWIWSSLYSQISPDGTFQSLISSFAKNFSDTKMWYDLLQEQAEKLKLQSEELKKEKQRNGYLDKITKLQEELRWEYEIIIQWYKQKELTCTNETNQKIISPNMNHTLSQNDTNTLFTTTSNIWNQLEKEMWDKDLKFKIIKTNDWHINIWIEYKEKRSIWFYAELPRFQNIITKSWMKWWIQDRVQQLNTMESIEKIATWKWISFSFWNNWVSMKINQLYNGNNEVIISDSFSKKTSKFIVDPKKYSQEDIIKQLDIILTSFLN